MFGRCRWLALAKTFGPVEKITAAAVARIALEVTSIALLCPMSLQGVRCAAIMTVGKFVPQSREGAVLLLYDTTRLCAK